MSIFLFLPVPFPARVRLIEGYFFVPLKAGRKLALRGGIIPDSSARSEALQG
jgi:hypothetical protein